MLLARQAIIEDYPVSPSTAGRTLTKLRVDLGLTKKRLAGLAGVNEATIARCERDRPCQWRTLRKIRDAVALLESCGSFGWSGFEELGGAKLTPERVRSARVVAALSQHDLAKLAGLNECTIRHIESGLHKPTPRTLQKLATALNNVIGNDTGLIA